MSDISHLFGGQTKGIQSELQMKMEKEKKNSGDLSRMERFKASIEQGKRDQHDSMRLMVGIMSAPPSPPTSDSSNGQQAQHMAQIMTNTLLTRAVNEGTMASLTQAEVLESLRLPLLSNLIGQKVEVKNNPHMELENGKLAFDYQVDDDTEMVEIEIWDRGEIIKHMKGNPGFGRHRVHWNGLDDLMEQRPDGDYRINVTITPKDKKKKPHTATTYSYAKVETITTDQKGTYLGVGHNKQISMEDLTGIAGKENSNTIHKEQLEEIKHVKEEIKKVYERQGDTIFHSLKNLLDTDVNAETEHFQLDHDKHQGPIPASYEVKNNAQSATVEVLDQHNKPVFQTKGNHEHGIHLFPWEGKAANGSPLPSGPYKLRASSEKIHQDISESQGHSGMIHRDMKQMLHFTYEVPVGTKESNIEILNDQHKVIYEQKGIVFPGNHVFDWNGQRKNGEAAPAGEYRLRTRMVVEEELPITVRGRASRIVLNDQKEPYVTVDGHDVPARLVKAVHHQGTSFSEAMTSLEERHIAESTILKSKLDTLNQFQSKALAQTQKHVELYETTSKRMEELTNKTHSYQEAMKTSQENLFSFISEKAKNLVIGETKTLSHQPIPSSQRIKINA